MADEPADDDDEARARDWNAAKPTVLDEAVPFELMAEPNTDPHALEQSAEFRAGIEVGRALGEREGFARGQAEGRADVQSGDWAAGVEDALAALRVYLFSEGIVHVEEFSDKIRERIKRS